MLVYVPEMGGWKTSPHQKTTMNTIFTLVRWSNSNVQSLRTTS
jgi:hypothetical protein